MRELTAKEIENLDASALAAYFREQARAEIARKKEDAANAAKFQSIALPYIEAGIPFDSFMSQTQCPSSFRSRYEKLQTQYRTQHAPSPEEAERLKLEREVQAAMGISSADPQQQAEPTGYQGRDYFSAWAQYSQSQQDKQRRRFGIGGTNAASESPEQPEEPDGDDSEPDDPTPDDPDSEPDSAEPEQPEQPESPEGDPAEPEHGEPSDNA